MKTKILLNLFIFSCLYSVNSNAQVPPDSLPGHYIGEYWFRVENDPWTIRIDTVWVTNIDTNGCFMQMNTWDNVQWNVPFCTHYYYCYGNPDNLYQLFHSNDSIEIIADNISTPPPYPETQSHRFYGKKTYVPVGIENTKTIMDVCVYPNPATNHISLSSDYVAQSYYIYSVAGDIAKSGIIKYNNKIDISGLSKGLYFLQYLTKKEIITTKFIKQ